MLKSIPVMEFGPHSTSGSPSTLLSTGIAVAERTSAARQMIGFHVIWDSRNIFYFNTNRYNLNTKNKKKNKKKQEKLEKL